MVSFIKAKTINDSWNGNGQTDIIMFRIMLLLNTKMWKNYCNTNQFPELSFCGPHSKLHCAKGLSKHYHLHLYPKLGMGICAIRRITCACVAYTSMLDKTSVSVITPDEQEHYKHITKYTYWPVLGSFNNWNLVQLSQKSSPSDAFDWIHQVFSWNKW